MNQKFITLGAAGPEEKEATSISTGVAQAGEIPALDGTGRLDQSLMPVGVGPDAQMLVAFETIAAGAFVYVKSDGTIANASAAVGGKPATGFVLAGGSAGASLLVHFEGRNTSLSGLTPGTVYFLSDTTPGTIITTAPVGAGKYYQIIGTAVTVTSLNTELTTAVLRA